MQLELCFGLHMQVVFIAWLLASLAIVEFVLSIVCRRPGYFVSLTMGCVVVTEPFDLTLSVEDTRSTLQIGCKPTLAASASQDGWTHS